GYGSPRPDREKAGPSPVRGVDGFLPGSDSPLLPDQHPRSDGGGEEGPTGPGTGLSRGGCEERAGSPPGCRRVGGREGGGAGSVFSGGCQSGVQPVPGRPLGQADGGVGGGCL